ncbi:MAG: cytochrome b N-terminal domain-containing protein [Anaerolineales bacterium]|nr:cytochrome b N-terminal domain-containing protein [Anaerolineales bacterium]
MAIFRPHIPFLDEVKAKGVRRAGRDKADDIVTRVTAGLNSGDVRSLLRDDPPGRPNPRLTPHAEGFWLHMRPTYYHNLMDGIYPTFRLGWLSTFFFVFEIITGAFLMVYYTPSPDAAYANMLNLLGNVFFGSVMRDLHKLGAEAMVLVVALHMLRTFVTGSYKKPRQFTWATGVILLGVTLFLSFSGYLLPWDQLSLWAVTIGASMVEAFPPEVVGQTLNLIVRGGPEFNADGLLRFYLLHILLLPLIGLIAFGVHYYKVIHHGHSLPPEAEKVGEDTAKRVPMERRVYFMPKIITRELFYIVALVFLFMAAAAFFYEAPLEIKADPLITPLHTTAPWYFLWLQGMLKMGDKVIWGVIVPTVLIGLLVVLPYFEVGPSRRYGDRRIGLSIAALSVAALAVLSFMGTPWYAVSTSAEQEAIATLVPQTHPGPLRETDWAALELGSFAASEYASAPNPEMAALLETFHEEVAKVNDATRSNAEGFMVVEDWQTNLKKITLRVVWTHLADGTPGEYSQVTYLDSQAAYERGGGS